MKLRDWHRRELRRNPGYAFWSFWFWLREKLGLATEEKP